MSIVIHLHLTYKPFTDSQKTVTLKSSLEKINNDNNANNNKICTPIMKHYTNK